jgi:hypothetical protein
MYAICKETEIKVFGEEEHIISREDFLSRQENYQIIFDMSDIDFSLEKLSCCSLWDAYIILLCQRKALAAHEDAFLVPQNFWGRRTRHIQKNSMKNCELFQLVSSKNGIFLMENIIAEFCRDPAGLREETWWIYAADHLAAGVRIIAGIGRGIVLSRFLGSDVADVPGEVLKTIIYLKRFGLEGDIKVITGLKEVTVHLGKNKFCEIVQLDGYQESTLVEFLSRNRTIKKAFIRSSITERFLSDKKFHFLQYSIAFFLFFGFVILSRATDDEKKSMRTLQKNELVVTDNLNLEINVDNLLHIKQLITALKDCANPIGFLAKVSEMCSRNKIQVEQLSMENGNQMKIKTSLHKEQFEKLQKSSGDQLDVQITISSGEEYEELSTDKKLGVVLCIKAK